MNSKVPQPFQIGTSTIGPGSPVYVIAEAGVNHDGDTRVARELVRAAAEAGADAVKFQVFSADRLVTRAAPAAAYQQQAASAATQHELLSRLELGHDDFAQLCALARSMRIEFLATPFSEADLQFLVSLGVRALKFASPDIVNRPLLDAAVSSGLPVIASTGAADLEEVAAAVECFRRPGAGRLALLHCVSSYPTPDAEANLAAIGTLARKFDCVSGYSDHTQSLTMGGYAVAAGACIIEKHLTLDRARRGPDHSFSLEPHQMADYIRSIRQAELLMGHGCIAPSESQREIRNLARGSVVATREIVAGQVIALDMLTVKRPGGGIAPSELRSLVGRKATRNIAADTPLSRDAIE